MCLTYFSNNILYYIFYKIKIVTIPYKPSTLFRMVISYITFIVLI